MTATSAFANVLPAPTNRRLLTSLYTPAQKRRYVMLCIAWALSVTWFWVWWLDPAHFVGWVPFLFATIPLIWIHGLQLFFVYVMLQASRTSAPDPAPGEWRVAMIVTKTPSEPFDVLEKTMRAMLDQDYPHDTWLADEDPSAETLEWCRINGVNVSSRNGIAAYHQKVWPRRTRCKEGNLAYFYETWGYRDYDIVSQLDADHVPQPGYLREIVRPFADAAVGYVSAPSICAANADTSWAARTRLHTEAAFHGLFQTGYTKAFTPMCIGSHYAVRTAALAQAGGLGPDLAEDHSTTMLLASSGWRGVHAIDAIAIGDGPNSITDLVTQEFQWSRSLLTVLLQHTGPYLARLPMRLRFLFVFCQLWYPLFAATSAMLYLAPIFALAFDLRYADVTYPDFILHAAPGVIFLTIAAYMIRKDCFFRPVDAPVLSWEKALFLTLQWPWNLWGCAMAVRDKLTGTFVDFRITPKGNAAQQTLPLRVLLPYTLLALGAALPVFFSEDLANARGFLLLALLNAVMYGSLVVIIVWHHLAQASTLARQAIRTTAFQIAASFSVCIAVLGGLVWRGVEGAHALAFGLEPFQLVRVEFGLAGAGQKAKERLYFVWDPGWALADELVPN